MKLLILIMSYLKYVNMLQMMTRLLYDWLVWIMPSLICKRWSHGQKNQKKGRHEWEKACVESGFATLKTENSNENQICQYNDSIWKIIGVQKNYDLVLWVEDIAFTKKIPKAEVWGLANDNYDLIKEVEYFKRLHIDDD